MLQILVNRQDAEKILENELPTYVGYFCIRPRPPGPQEDPDNVDKPYALSHVLNIGNDGTVEIEHFYIYWNDETGFSLDKTDTRGANLLTLKYVWKTFIMEIKNL